MAASALDGIFIINRVLDLIFTLDMVLQFILIYADGAASDTVRWVVEPGRIAAHCALHDLTPQTSG